MPDQTSQSLLTSAAAKMNSTPSPWNFFALQIKTRRRLSENLRSTDLSRGIVEHWTQIPAVPTAAFKELDLTCLASAECTAVFHSSGTTEQRPSRHFHNPESLAFYEGVALALVSARRDWSAELRFGLFPAGLLFEPIRRSALRQRGNSNSSSSPRRQRKAPHSSLVHMLETHPAKIGRGGNSIRRQTFQTTARGCWISTARLRCWAIILNPAIRNPKLILGTAFSFVHLPGFSGG